MDLVKRSMFRKSLVGVSGLTALRGLGLYFWKGPGRPTRIGQLLGRSENPAQAAKGDTYYCPMHPNYKSDKPGNCPICSMKLVKLEQAPAAAAAGQQGMQ